ncbi:hypothetical protein GCM10010524_21960 [Streptomyces mexicanus]
MAPLDGALPLSEMSHGARAVPDDLDLDVPGAGQQVLDVDLVAAEGAPGLRTAALEGPGQVVRVAHRAHPASAAARDRLDHHPGARPQTREEVLRLRQAHPARCRREDRHTVPGGEVPCAGLVAEQGQQFGGGADEGQSRPGAQRRELRVLAEESVTGMDQRATGAPGDVHDPLGVEIGRDALAGQRMRLVGQAHVRRVAVLGGEHGDGPQPESGGGAVDADGDLPAVGDQDTAHGMRAHRMRPLSGRSARSESALTLASTSIGWSPWRVRGRRGARG